MTFRCAISRSSSPTVSTDRLARAPSWHGRSLARWLAAAVLLSGCVSAAVTPSPTDPHPTTTTLSPTTTVTHGVEEALVAFRDCLADAGVVIQEVELDGRGRPWLARALSGLNLSDRVVAAALGECAPELANGAMELTPDQQMRTAVMAGLADFASCMRSNGVADFPDPSPRFTGVGAPFPESSIPWADPDLPTAVIICNRALVDGP